MSIPEAYTMMLASYQTLIDLEPWWDGRREQLVAKLDRLFRLLPDLVLVDGVKRSPMIEEYMREVYVRRISGA